ncbi:nucleoside deaminase [Peptoniphilus equinus]|uniref:tRNA-specific adenosine deaminase n=1 Tax=Peptoniphilus equinus TaxID=3016343 RepID=A0ABY7QT25_9FIRM|nr:nucleoside deaminase [Peptoniphilus equinus]WBW49887.1 nucleoside deaminase [Peptoniphilus equinus]
MDEALALAKKSMETGDVPIGAVVVRDGVIIGRGFNQKEHTGLASEHAEMIALKEAAATLGHSHLEDCTLYVTLEPCLMCAGAMVNFRLGKVVIGARNGRFGCCGTSVNVLTTSNHEPDVVFTEDQRCSQLLSSFFKQLRTMRKG